MALADLLAMSQGSPVPIHNDAVQIAAQAEEQRRRRDQQQQNQQLAMAMMGQLREQNRMAMLRQQHEQEMRDAAYNQRMRPLSKGFEIAQATGPQELAEFLRSNRGALGSIGVPVGPVGMTKEEQAAAQFFRPEEWEQIKSRYRTYDAARPVITGRASEALSAAQKRNQAIPDKWQRIRDWETWKSSPVGRAVETIIGPQPDPLKSLEVEEKYENIAANRAAREQATAAANAIRAQNAMSQDAYRRGTLAERGETRKSRERIADRGLTEAQRRAMQMEAYRMADLARKAQEQLMPSRGNILGYRNGQPVYRSETTEAQQKEQKMKNWRDEQFRREQMEGTIRQQERGRMTATLRDQYSVAIAERNAIQTRIDVLTRDKALAERQRKPRQTIAALEAEIKAKRAQLEAASRKVAAASSQLQSYLSPSSPSSRTATPSQAAPRPMTPRPTPTTPRAGMAAVNRVSEQLAGKSRNRFLP